MLLDRDSSNAILYAVASLSAGPAVAATLHCMRKMLREKDLDPARDFVRGYRLNVAVALRSWAPAVATATILLLNLGHLAGSEAATAPALRAAILLVALIGALWLTNMLVISTSFTFRLRDLARLSVFYLGASLRITLGNLGCLFLAGALLVLASEWSLLLAGSVLVGLVALTTADLDAQVEARFTAAADDTAKTTHLPEQGQDRGPDRVRWRSGPRTSGTATWSQPRRREWTRSPWTSSPGRRRSPTSAPTTSPCLPASSTGSSQPARACASRRGRPRIPPGWRALIPTSHGLRGPGDTAVHPRSA